MRSRPDARPYPNFSAQLSRIIFTLHETSSAETLEGFQALDSLTMMLPVGQHSTNMATISSRSPRIYQMALASALLAGIPLLYAPPLLAAAAPQRNGPFATTAPLPAARYRPLIAVDSVSTDPNIAESNGHTGPLFAAPSAAAPATDGLLRNDYELFFLPSLVTNGIGRPDPKRYKMSSGIYDTSGALIPDLAISITYTAPPTNASDDAGHVAAYHSSARPVTYPPSATFQVSGRSDASGVFRYDWTSPEVTGPIDIRISWTYLGVQRFYDSHTFVMDGVRDSENSGLLNTFSMLGCQNDIDCLTEASCLQWPQYCSYVLYGETSRHPANHFGSPRLVIGLQSLAAAWQASSESRGNRFPRIIAINDMSLRYGGLFDAEGTHAPPHQTHRNGNTADIRTRDPVSNRRISPADLRSLIATARSVGFGNFLIHTGIGEKAAPHLHATVTDSYLCKAINVPDDIYCPSAIAQYLLSGRPVRDAPLSGISTSSRNRFGRVGEEVQAQSALNSSVMCDVAYDTSLALYSYHYRLANDATSAKAIMAFGLGPLGQVASFSTPDHWSGSMSFDGIADLIGWMVADDDTAGPTNNDTSPVDSTAIPNIKQSPFDLMPGQSRDGFTIYSQDPPGWVRFFAQPFDTLAVGESDDVESMLIRDGVTGFVTGPVRILGVRPQSPPPGNGLLRAPFPNPSTHKVQFQFEIMHEADVLLDLVDVAGRRIAIVEKGHYTAGLHTTQLNWSSRGIDTPMPGVYFARLIINGKIGAQRPVTILGP